MAGRAWIKLYERWLTCPRHAELSGDTLGTGALLLLVAESMGVDGEAGVRWMLGPTGAPVTLASCHRHVRVRSNSCRARVGQLLDVGTMVERDDGCLGFSKYRQWQENPSAGRVRKHREKRDSPVTSNVTRNREAEAEAEAEGEAEAEAELTPVAPLAEGGRPPPHAWISEIWRWFETERCQIQEHARPRGLSDKQRRAMKGLATHARQTIGEKRGHEEAVKSIRAFLADRLAEARAKSDQTKWLVHASTWRTATWDRWRNFQERERGRQISDDYEKRAADEKKQRARERTNNVLDGMFAE